MQKILIIGATSAIAEATARLYAEQGSQLFLTGRNTERLEVLVKDLRLRGAKSVHYASLDINDVKAHADLLQKAIKEMDGLDIVLIACGTLPDQKRCEQSVVLTQETLNTNAVSIIALLTLLANIFEEKKQGTIAVITSVAGERGRQSNYIYGAAKGMISIFLQGLRNRLCRSSGVNVLDIKPGFVDTPMTAEFKKGLLWVTPEQVAKGIVKGIEKKKSTIYTPFFWRYIMWVIRMIPEGIFKRMGL